MSFDRLGTHLLLIFVFGLLPSKSICQHQEFIDCEKAGALPDAVASFTEYEGATSGTYAGFGDIMGARSVLFWDSDTSGNLFLALNGGGAPFSDYIVIYIDAHDASGFSSTLELNDLSNEPKSAISGGTGSQMTFAEGFTPEYAIVISSTTAELYLLDVSSFILINTLTYTPGFSSPPSTGETYFELSGFNVNELGLQSGESFDYVATYLTSTGFRSNEFHGVAESHVPATNPGINPITLPTGAFSRFYTVPGVSRFDEVICLGDSVDLFGVFQSSSGVFGDTLTSWKGCDSIVVVNLRVDTVDYELEVVGDSIKVMALESEFQWLDCDGVLLFPEDTLSGFLAPFSGSFFVEVTQGGCVDTSGCISIVLTQTQMQNELTNEWVHPNPIADQINLMLPEGWESARVTVTTLDGRILFHTYDHSFSLDAPSGVYYVIIENQRSELRRLELLKR